VENKKGCIADHWNEIEKMLVASPRLQGKTVIAYLIKKYPNHYQQKHLRTLQRRIRNWRAEKGSAQPVIFRQDVKPGKQSQSDYTCMNDLNITIHGQAFKHLLFHFMLIIRAGSRCIYVLVKALICWCWDMKKLFGGLVVLRPNIARTT
jgi:hypothetical protein